MTEHLIDVSPLQSRLRDFASERDWAKFHTPRNLAMALAGEVGELLAEIQWITDEAVLEPVAGEQVRDRVALELADIATYLARLADVLQIDLDDAVRRKLALVADRYVPDDIRGRADKR